MYYPKHFLGSPKCNKRLQLTLLMSPSLNAIKATNPHATRNTINNNKHMMSVQWCFFNGPFQFITSPLVVLGGSEEVPRAILVCNVSTISWLTLHYSFLKSINTLNLFYFVLVFWLTIFKQYHFTFIKWQSDRMFV